MGWPASGQAGVTARERRSPSTGWAKNGCRYEFIARRHTRHADLPFEVVSRRYQQKPIVLTTNKSFREWNEVFPSAGCLVTLIDRLIHKAEIVEIEAESYRLKEALERSKEKAKERSAKRSKGKKT